MVANILICIIYGLSVFCAYLAISVENAVEMFSSGDYSDKSIDEIAEIAIKNLSLKEHLIAWCPLLNTAKAIQFSMVN